ncbi:hypothetical protein GW17_00020166 [Ensete ventricosum]|nr:hypothetical protein GW17_00020166 [Ensete ventricosum]
MAKRPPTPPLAAALSPPPAASDQDFDPNCCSLEKFRLYETRARFFRVLKIDRSEPSELNISEDPVVYSPQEVKNLLQRIGEGNRATGGLIFVGKVYGIAGTRCEVQFPSFGPRRLQDLVLNQILSLLMVLQWEYQGFPYRPVPPGTGGMYRSDGLPVCGPLTGRYKLQTLFLGYFQPQEGKPALWELETDYYLHVARIGDEAVPDSDKSLHNPHVQVNLAYLVSSILNKPILLQGPVMDPFEHDPEKEKHYADALCMELDSTDDALVEAEMATALKEYDQIGADLGIVSSCKGVAEDPSQLTRWIIGEEKVQGWRK